MPKGRKDINKDSVPFSKENQPTPEQKKAGHKRKRDLSDLANALISGERLEKCKAIASRVGLDLSNNEYTLDVAMTLTQIAKSIDEGDTRAYTAAMDRLLGKPLQKQEIRDMTINVNKK